MNELHDDEPKEKQVNFGVGKTIYADLQRIYRRHGLSPTEMARRMTLAGVQFFRANGWLSFPLLVTPEEFQRELRAAEDRGDYGRSVGHVRTDRERRVIHVDDGFTSMCGHTVEQMRGKKVGEVLQGPLTEPGVVEAMRLAMDARVPFEGLITNYDAHGRAYRAHVRIVPTAEGFEGTSRRLD